ncbi:hypothetical protein UFOVP5_57 [uncultured Caudovirales phage]|uniref:Uncharacterized protein n=1 Tax=uncultured Caudovirales phage TaxID=2100421 RepID=A0A6J5KK98_9CAUD|nr:hypothetical protein UFOVP5_57 [uncultured Caudovirales phage]
MLKYKVLERSLIGNEIFEEGAIVDYDGYPSSNLEPQCDEGRAKASELVQINKQRIKQMQLDNPASPTIDQDAFAKAIATAISASNAEHADRMAQVTEILTALQDSLSAPVKAK